LNELSMVAQKVADRFVSGCHPNLAEYRKPHANDRTCVAHLGKRGERVRLEHLRSEIDWNRRGLRGDGHSLIVGE
jgi:hypothetical protein